MTDAPTPSASSKMPPAEVLWRSSSGGVRSPAATSADTVVAGPPPLSRGSSPEHADQTSRRVTAFHHIRFLAGNALLTANYMTSRMGFTKIAERNLETGSRVVASHVLRQGLVIVVVETLIAPVSATGGDAGDEMVPPDVRADFARLPFTGDYAKDVAFRVDDCAAVHAAAVARGAVSVQEPTVQEDEDGKVTIAAVRTYGNVIHSFIQDAEYKGTFLPGYRAYTGPSDPLSLPSGLVNIDHVVGNQDDQEMKRVTDWYEKILGFHQFWSIDDKTLNTPDSALRSTVMASANDAVKMPITEPADGPRKSQIKEFVEYNGSEGGVQHIAFRTHDILHTIRTMRSRGVQFLRVPDTYYQQLRKRLELDGVALEEDFDELQKLGILIDYDDEGYLLQLFSRPQQDRPTYFFEIIQRHNNNGFGAGNFKALFEAVQAEQKLRGNL